VTATATGTGFRQTLAGRRPVVLLTLLGAGLVLLAGTRTWANVSIDTGPPGLSELTVAGRRSVPSAIPIALAAAAGAVVLATSGRGVRLLVAAGLVLAGAVVAISSVQAARDWGRALDAAAQETLGVSGTRAGPDGTVFGAAAGEVDMTIWPWVCVVGGVVILLAGLLAVIGGRSWPGPTRRYERAPGAADRIGSAGRPGRAVAAGSAPGREDTPASTWDALSRGEDPTSPSDDVT
jgi:uncharacterized membrane protein (TIGR02234 family)